MRMRFRRKIMTPEKKILTPEKILSSPDCGLQQDRSLAGDNCLWPRGEQGGRRGLGSQAHHPRRLTEAHQSTLLTLTGQHGEVLGGHNEARLTTRPGACHHHLALGHHPKLGSRGCCRMTLQLELACGDQLSSCQLELLSIGQLQLLARSKLQTATSRQLQGLMNSARSGHLNVTRATIAIDSKAAVLLLLALILQKRNLLRCRAAFP